MGETRNVYRILFEKKSEKRDRSDQKRRGQNKFKIFLISNFRRVLYVVCFLLGNSPASEFYMPTFRNTLFHLFRLVRDSSPTSL